MRQSSKGITRRRLLWLIGIAGAGGYVASRYLHADSSERRPGSSPEDHLGWSQRVELVDHAGRDDFPVHCILLPSGEVLVAGGRNRFIAFRLDPSLRDSPLVVQGIGVPMRRPEDSLFCAGHGHMNDGRLLFAGGQRPVPEEKGLAYGTVHDPASRRWTSTRFPMTGGARWYPAVTRLPDGRMLVTTGLFDWGETPNRSVELFDPEAFDAGLDPWTRLIGHSENPWKIEPTGADYTHVFLLREPVDLDGAARQVVMMGKTGRIHFFNYADDFEDPADRFAVRPRSLRPGPKGLELRADGASSVQLPDGQVMVVGGTSDEGIQRRADIYDPARDAWTSLDTGIGRYFPATLLLPDGRVMITNGDMTNRGDPRAPQIVDPATGEIDTGPAWSGDGVRGYHNVALLLPDGRVLTGGGGRKRTDIRYFSPRYLARPNARPRIVAADAEMSYLRTHVVRYSNGPVHRATMISLGAMTHCFDQSQRFVELPITSLGPNELRVKGPASPVEAPPGHYMLFLLRESDRSGGAESTPSIAKITRLVEST